MSAFGLSYLDYSNSLFLNLLGNQLDKLEWDEKNVAHIVFWSWKVDNITPLLGAWLAISPPTPQFLMHLVFFYGVIGLLMLMFIVWLIASSLVVFWVERIELASTWENVPYKFRQWLLYLLVQQKRAWQYSRRTLWRSSSSCINGSWHQRNWCKHL